LEAQKISRGSGCVISKDGYIVTNNHVIEDAEEIYVQFLEGDEYPAQLIERDPTTDIALIKIDATNLNELTLADSSKVEVGEWVLLIGNPLGMQASVSSGIVSGNERTLPGSLLIQEFFQTDAAMNHGNSGGPLLNLDGDVIGMNSCMLTSNGGNIGLGFSIPSNLIKEVLEDLSEHKRPIRGYLDMLLFPIDLPTAFTLGLPKHQGAYVYTVGPTGPAGKAGFHPGDVIVNIQDTPVKELGQLRTAIALSKPGEKLSFIVYRGTQQLSLCATVGTEPGPSAQALKVENELKVRLKPTLVDVNKDNALKTGLLVSEIDTTGPAYRAGLRIGQIILEANGKSASSIDEFSEEVFKKSFLSLTIFHVLENNKVHSIYFFR
jgi:serine protease Do